MTRDVLDRLLATCSSRPSGGHLRPCGSAASAPSDPTSPTLHCLAIQRGRPRPVSQTRRGGCFCVAASTNGWSVGPGPRAIDRRKAVEERALARLSINLIVERRCTLVGLNATEFAALGLRSARARCNSGSSVRRSRCLATSVKVIRDCVKASQLTLWERFVSFERLLSADNSKAMHQKSRCSPLGTPSGVNNSLTL